MEFFTKIIYILRSISEKNNPMLMSRRYTTKCIQSEYLKFVGHYHDDIISRNQMRELFAWDIAVSNGAGTCTSKTSTERYWQRVNIKCRMPYTLNEALSCHGGRPTL